MWATPFVFIDPTVAFRRFVPFFLRRLEFFSARFRSILLIGRAAGHRAKGDRDNHAKKNKEDYRPHPCGKQEARLLGMSECIFVVRHG